MRHAIAMLTLVPVLSMASIGLSFAGGPGSGGGTATSGEGDITAELRNASEPAKAAYYSGIKLVKKAQAYEEEASKASTPEKNAKLHDKAQGAYREAVPALIDAVVGLPKLYQAWNTLGFANLRLGNFEDSLSAYTKAVEINPNHPEAIAGRGEACLGLNMVDDAKAAYERLGDAHKQAEELMAAMHRWVDAHRQGAEDLTPAEVEAFTKWVDQRPASASPGN
jgi:tetratricopeptide (TPR) repeat protein